jgi:hypothetical protein
MRVNVIFIIAISLTLKIAPKIVYIPQNLGPATHLPLYAARCVT